MICAREYGGPGLERMEFILGRRLLPTTPYNPTPANPHECWIVSVERSTDKQRTEKKMGLEMRKIGG